MRRYFFYLAVGLITFCIGFFACFSYALCKVNSIDSEVLKRTKNNETVPKQSVEKAKKNEPSNNDCYDVEIKPFWDKLDKEGFLQFKRAKQKFQTENYSDTFRAQWARLSEKFSCKYFTGIEKKDLNNDSEEEIIAKGEITSNRGDREIFVFRSEHGKLKPILFEIAGRFIETTGKKFKGFSEIIIKSEYFTNGGRKINRYRFNGKFYIAVKCV